VGDVLLFPATEQMPAMRCILPTLSIIQLDPRMPPLRADAAHTAEQTFDRFPIMICPILAEMLPIADVHSGEVVGNFDSWRRAAVREHRRKFFSALEFERKPVRRAGLASRMLRLTRSLRASRILTAKRSHKVE